MNFPAYKSWCLYYLDIYFSSVASFSFCLYMKMYYFNYHVHQFYWQLLYTHSESLCIVLFFCFSYLVLVFSLFVCLFVCLFCLQFRELWSCWFFGIWFIPAQEKQPDGSYLLVILQRQAARTIMKPCVFCYLCLPFILTAPL